MRHILDGTCHTLMDNDSEERESCGRHAVRIDRTRDGSYR